MFAPSVPRRIASFAALLTLAATAQEPGPLGRTGADYFRAPVGTVWEYARTFPGAAGVRVEVLCRRESVAAGTRTVELRAFDGSATEVRYWLTSEAGLCERLCHATAARAGEPEGAWAWRGGTMKTEVIRRGLGEVELCWLACPPGLHTEWALERPSPDEGPGCDHGFPALRYTARVESFAEAVTVPAGTFTTIKVAMEVRAADASLHQRVELWLARDVGAVQRVVSSVSGQRSAVLCSDVLTAWRTPASPLEAARAFVRARTDRWPQEPELVPLDDPRLRSLLCTRFVLVRAGSGHALLAVDRDGARVYDPSRRRTCRRWPGPNCSGSTAATRAPPAPTSPTSRAPARCCGPCRSGAIRSLPTCRGSRSRRWAAWAAAGRSRCSSRPTTGWGPR